MAQPARSPSPPDPPVDPTAIRRAYRMERAKRRHRIQHARDRRLARFRFFVIIFLLLALGIFFTIVVWTQVSRLFGL